MTDIKSIGVVAGAGPFAGVDLLNKIFEQTRAAKDQEHLDVIGLFRPAAITDRTSFLLDPKLPNPGFAIARQVLELETMGASVAGIPCNTAHAPAILEVTLAELDRAGAKIVFLNMISEVVQHIRTVMPQAVRIGILSTTGTYRSDLYPAYLQAAGLQAITPDEDMQIERIHPAIVDPQFGIKVLGRNAQKARQHLLDGLEQLVHKGAQAVVLGCTEIPLAIPEGTYGTIPLVDATVVLARALIREVAPERLKPFSP